MLYLIHPICFACLPGIAADRIADRSLSDEASLATGCLDRFMETREPGFGLPPAPVRGIAPAPSVLTQSSSFLRLWHCRENRSFDSDD
ncbi:hypothetical protein [Sphingobium sp. CFD-2]|uniref:hypothetical protein n=1 Tax=Sphingobium sp. CFD-2 TaxID=2878542 RepID=UPI00214BE0D9|nr:hypothetical protein [Sphingobium sp. CFD-2]